MLRKDMGVGGTDNGNFFLIYELKMCLRRRMGGSKRPKHPYVIKRCPLQVFECIIGIS